MVEVLPGASERALVAMRMGYIGFERESVPGQVRQALMRDLLPTGGAATSRIGDYVLENGHLLAAVTLVDGKKRGGQLIDLAKKPKSVDGLGSLELRVLGRELIYDSLHTGFDESTNAAYIEVSGRVDLRQSAGPLLTVSTRYDAAPGVEAVLVHTHVKVDAGTVDPDSSEPLLEEVLLAQGSSRVLIDSDGGYAASFGEHGGYIVRALGDPGMIVASASVATFRVPASAAPATGGALVVSRVIAPLERPDTAALGVAVAKTEGHAVGDVEVRVASGRGVKPPKRGRLTFVAADGQRFLVCGAAAHGEDSHFEAKLPAGAYTVAFNNDGILGDPAKVVIEGDRLVFVTVGGRPVPAAGPLPKDAPAIEASPPGAPSALAPAAFSCTD